ncbi:hypothetical protein Y1Q_0000566 [Alligator mississippiensis]|uniref:Uncharacterized protein n=1 Tax=Alligator mississippiensis TaxID=8496 RepID=A0A151MBK1_ALLMI|nr:hypothetical protein Y1Q_0000566 [Alligator mississippiensis]
MNLVHELHEHIMRSSLQRTWFIHKGDRRGSTSDRFSQSKVSVTAVVLPQFVVILTQPFSCDGAQERV